MAFWPFVTDLVEATSDDVLTPTAGTSRSPTPDFPFSDLQHSTPRYAHGRASRYSDFPRDEAQASSSASSSLLSSASSSPGYKIDLDYSAVAKKASGKKERKGKHH